MRARTSASLLRLCRCGNIVAEPREGCDGAFALIAADVATTRGRGSRPRGLTSCTTTAATVAWCCRGVRPAIVGGRLVAGRRLLVRRGWCAAGHRLFVPGKLAPTQRHIQCRTTHSLCSLSLSLSLTSSPSFSLALSIPRSLSLGRLLSKKTRAMVVLEQTKASTQITRHALEQRLSDGYVQGRRAAAAGCFGVNHRG